MIPRSMQQPQNADNHDSPFDGVHFPDTPTNRTRGGQPSPFGNQGHMQQTAAQYNQNAHGDMRAWEIFMQGE